VTENKAAHPLAGLKVLDLSRVLAGPYAARMLADLGADVVKVEPPEGDLTRTLGNPKAGMTEFYVQQNVGKRNISVDMKAPGAAELILQMVKGADLLIENYRPGVMARLGLGWDVIHAANPKLVMLSISGFGQNGPESQRAAFAPIIHAESGFIHRQAKATDQQAVDLSLSVADTYSGLHGLVGALSALMVAKETGLGQHVDIAMISVMHSIDDHSAYIRDGSMDASFNPRTWVAPEGIRLIISGSMKWLWRVFSTQGGLSDPTPPGADLETKLRIREETLIDHFENYSSFDAFIKQLDQMNLAWGRVRQSGEDAYSLPSVEGLGILVDIDDGQGSQRTTVQSPYRFSHSGSGITPASKAPHKGEHNATVLQDWLSLSDDQIDALKDTGILHQDLEGQKIK
jgi:CoA:oxalate CoA-transferase